MSEKKRQPGDIVHEISVLDLLISSGITVSSIARDIIQTDKMYSERWQVETANMLAALSDMLHDAITIHKDTLNDLRLEPPTNITIVVVRNPLMENSMSTPPSDEEGYDITGGSEFPF